MLCFVTTLNSCRILRNTNANYAHFVDSGVFLAPFYWIRIFNLDKHGRQGYSKTMGLGNHPMSNYWYYSLPGMRPFVKHGCLSIIICLFAYIIAHFIWLLELSPVNVLITVLILVSTSQLYLQFFYKQNYNVFGWAFLPLVLFALHTNGYLLLVISLVLVSLSSITVLFVCCVFIVSYSVIELPVTALLCIIPGCLVFLYNLVAGSGFLKSISKVSLILETIGAYKKSQVKYKRTRKIGYKTLGSFILPYIVYLIYYSYAYSVPFILLITFCLFCINYTLARFADDQSFGILFMSITVFYTMIANELNPILFFVFFFSNIAPFIKIFSCQPIDAAPISKGISQFINDVPEGVALLVAHHHPNDDYEKLFDDWVLYLDYLSYQCNVESIHPIPDFSTITETNYEGAPEFWCSEPDEVKSVLSTLESNYVVISQEPGTSLDAKWSTNKFIELATLDWKQLLDQLCIYVGPQYKRVKWFLLKYEG